MKTELVKAIFTNFLFVIGVIILIVGFVQGTNTLTKSVLFDQYPLSSWEETRCEMDPTYSRTAIDPSIMNADTTTEFEKAKQEERIEKCLASLEQQRNRNQVEDIVSSFTMLIVGAIMVFVFRGFIFTKNT